VSSPLRPDQAAEADQVLAGTDAVLTDHIAGYRRDAARIGPAAATLKLCLDYRDTGDLRALAALLAVAVARLARTEQGDR
jgi:hypothetical protein